jgi:hypothetical protein
MSNSTPTNKRARRQSRKITPSISAPAWHVETWCTVSGEDAMGWVLGGTRHRYKTDIGVGVPPIFQDAQLLVHFLMVP